MPGPSRSRPGEWAAPGSRFSEARSLKRPPVLPAALPPSRACLGPVVAAGFLANLTRPALRAKATEAKVRDHPVDHTVTTT